MKKVKSYIIALMICFTGTSVGSSIRDYRRFKADKAIFESAGADWEGAVRNALVNDLIWWGALMLMLAVALAACSLYLKKKDRQTEAE